MTAGIISAVDRPVEAVMTREELENKMAVLLGGLALLVIMSAFAWVVARARRIEVSTVHLGFLVAVATSVVGGIIGLLVATEMATGRDVVADGGHHGHQHEAQVAVERLPVEITAEEAGYRHAEGWIRFEKGRSVEIPFAFSEEPVPAAGR